MAKITLFNGSPVSANAELFPGSAAGYARSVEGLADAVDTNAKKVAAYASSGDTGPARIIGSLADMLGNLHDEALDKSDAVNQKLGGFNKIRDAEQQVANSVQDLSGAEGKTGGKAVQKLKEKYVKTTNDIADEVAKSIDNPEAKAAVLSEFERYQKIGAQNFTDKVRNLAQEEQEKSLYANLDSLSKTATINGPEGLQQAQGLLMQALTESKASGLITQDKADALQAQISKRIINTLNDNAISKDPQQVISDIKDGRYNYLSDEDKLSLYNKAQTVYTDFISKARIQDDVTGAADRDRMSALQTQLQLGIQDGTIDRTELMKYEEQLGGKGFNAMNALLQKKIFDDSVAANERLKLSDRIANGDDLSDVDPKSLNEHFMQSVVAAREEAKAKGQQLSPLQLEATVAARYNGPISAFTKKLEHAAVRGTPEQQTDAYNSVKVLESLKRDDIMAALPDKIQSRFAMADRYMNTLGLSAAEAFKEIDNREQQLKDPMVKQQVDAAWDKSKLNPKNPDYNIREVINSQMFDVGVFDKDAEIDFEVENNIGALLQDSFKETGDSDAAVAALTPRIKKTMGISNIGGTKRLMLYPPSKFGFTDVRVQQAMMQELPSATLPLEGGVTLNNAYLKAGPLTIRAIQQGSKNPPYEVRYKLNGIETFVLDKNGDPYLMTLEGAK